MKISAPEGSIGAESVSFAGHRSAIALTPITSLLTGNSDPAEALTRSPTGKGLTRPRRPPDMNNPACPSITTPPYEAITPGTHPRHPGTRAPVCHQFFHPLSLPVSSFRRRRRRAVACCPVHHHPIRKERMELLIC